MGKRRDGGEEKRWSKGEVEGRTSCGQIVGRRGGQYVDGQNGEVEERIRGGQR